VTGLICNKSLTAALTHSGPSTVAVCRSQLDVWGEPNDRAKAHLAWQRSGGVPLCEGVNDRLPEENPLGRRRGSLHVGLGVRFDFDIVSAGNLGG
jgi:hypothetical protein